MRGEPSNGSNQVQKRKQLAPPDGYSLVNNSYLYHEVQTAVVESNHWDTKCKWPRTYFKSRNRNVTAQIMPDPAAKLSDLEVVEWQERVAKYVLSLGDITADILDLVCIQWLKSDPRNFDEFIEMKASDFLQLRGLKQRSARGGGSGYRTRQKKEVEEQIAILRNFWIQVGENSQLPGERQRFFRSTAINTSSEVGIETEEGEEFIYAWRIRPGDVFMPTLLGDGRTLAPLTEKALQFDPYRRKLEKRLTRYLTWIWRIRHSKGHETQAISIQTLLERTKTEVPTRNSLRIKERLEEALDTLKSNKICENWAYDEETDYDILEKRGWVSKWLTWKVFIDPPLEVIEYFSQSNSIQEKPNSIKKSSCLDPLVSEMRKVRKSRGFTQRQLASQLEISSEYLSKIEQGRKVPSQKVVIRINTWMNQ
ncbi:MAG: helix-turn-helix domain-containing protein [Oligoflexales bacterium]